MRFIFAPDSFKGSLTAEKICEILTREAYRFFPDAECISLPVADGGEGTIHALLSIFGGEEIEKTITGPTGEPVQSSYARLPDGRCVVEMAKCCGLNMVSDKNRNPMYLTSYGLGEMIAHALRDGAEEILIGLGGSATNDGGIGLLSALGAVFKSESGRILEGLAADLSKVHSIDLANLNPLLSRAHLTVISDVTNPLLGETGATHVFGPQKGADSLMIEKLEKGMTNYADRFYDLLNMDIASFPGAGAAGGAGAALTGVLYAEMKKGIDTILDMADFTSLVRGASLVITGEGRCDFQTARFGKVPAGVLVRCEKHSVPCAVIVGGMGPGAEELYELGNSMIYPVPDGPMTLENAIIGAEDLVRKAADRIFWAFKAGIQMSKK